MILLGIDTGGTFTDFVLVNVMGDNNNSGNNSNPLIIHKVLSTPKAPEQAILQGIADLGLNKNTSIDVAIVHGSTVATNAVLEGKIARTVYISNRGMGDILTLGRQARRELYNLQPAPVTPPVPREYCIETGGRLSAQGELLEPLTETDLQQLVAQVNVLAPQAVAINLLFSFLDNQYEQAIEQVMPPELFVSRSSEILPEMKEYERGITTWLNASVGPVVKNYLCKLSSGVSEYIPDSETRSTRISVMQSSGGTIEATQAARQAVHMLLSGPAGGMAGAQFVAGCSGRSRLLTFDMGGTSTDVALIDGVFQLTSEGTIGNYPVAIPMVDMHTIGAGGGSIASIDEGGLLQVGPQSAGADPGPACYGQDGMSATVTDANLVLGRLRADSFLGGNMSLDVNAAINAIKPLAMALGLGVERMAQGIIDLANEHMVRALRVMSVQRGVDPKVLTLVSFGGAGGLHVCALAEALSMKQAIVPVNAGVLSALGMLVAPRARHLSQSFNMPVETLVLDELDTLFDSLAARGSAELRNEGLSSENLEILKSLDLRYTGQTFTLNIPWEGTTNSVENFHCKHELRYGHRLQQPVEILTARVEVRSRNHLPARIAELLQQRKNRQSLEITEARIYGHADLVKVYPRESIPVDVSLSGPLLVTEKVSTTYVQSGWTCHVDAVGNLLLERT